MNKVKNITIYLDYATVPSLNYFFDFAKNSEDRETIRLFGLSRFTLPDSIVSAYPEGVINFFKIENYDLSPLLAVLEELLSEPSSRWALNVHVNLAHQETLFISVVEKFLKHRAKIEHMKVAFYDDGSEGIATLHKISKMENLQESIVFEKQQMHDFFEKRTIANGFLTRYFWGEIFDAHYHLFKPELLDSVRLAELKKEIKHINSINYYQFAELNEHQRQLIFSILNISESRFIELRQRMQENDSFLFLGTTLFGVTSKNTAWLIKFHIEMLNQFCRKGGMFFSNKEGYSLFYKGHPHAATLNLMIKNAFADIVSYPDDIPLEVMLLLGIVPKRIGGFASTAILNFAPECIDDIIFITPPEYDKENFVYGLQHSLMHALIELGYLSPEKAHSHIDIIRKLKKEDYDIQCI